MTVSIPVIVIAVGLLATSWLVTVTALIAWRENLRELNGARATLRAYLDELVAMRTTVDANRVELGRGPLWPAGPTPEQRRLA